MKILYLSKALVVGAYQTKMEALAANGTLSLVAAVPPSWKDERGESRLERAHTEGYTLSVLPIFFNGSFHTHFYPTIGRLLDEIRPDLFHIDEEAYNFATFHAAWEAHRRKIPFLFFTWQNLLRHYPPPFRWMEQWVFNHAVHAIAGNEDAQQVLRQKGYLGATSVIPQFGVDLRLFEMGQRLERTASQDTSPIVFGYAGRFVEEKGLHLLLDALAGLQGLPWRCEMRGSGPAQAALEARAQALGIQAQVAFLPPLPSTEMGRFYREIDVFVLPSLTRSNWKEQFGRVLIEAMASGVVVVGSDSGEIPHVIGEAGLVVPESNIEALQGALRLLMLDAPLRQRLAHAGRRRVISHFTQSAIARHTHQLYEEILCGQQA
ncbi:MAG: glycosyltransferase family 4 protein [Ardenticatenales bacterium]|nr:glycosyltransferase family 4 protein [Ardenticatenales bacterium]